MKEYVRHIFGYILGFSLFFVLVPFALYELSNLDKLICPCIIEKYRQIRYILAIPIFCIGALFAIWSNIFLLKVGMGGPTEGFGIAVSPPTKKLVVTGPYRYCRNPMVFGAFSLYISWSIFLGSVLCLFVLVAFLFVAILYLANSEENRLLRDFGEEYLEYKKNVPMIFPLSIRKMVKRNS